MKAHIKVTENRHVILTRDDEDGRRYSTEYFAPRRYGDDGKLLSTYVRTIDSNGDCRQVFGCLGRYGDALCATPESLPAVIRRELQRMRAAEKRRAASRR